MGLDSCAIYGLESQGRSICSSPANEETIRFYVGTLSPRTEGQVHQIDFDEETNQISRKIYKAEGEGGRKIGEIWGLLCSPVERNLIALTYNKITDNSATLHSSIFQLPSENQQDLKCVCSLEDQECRGVDWHPTKASRLSLVQEGGFSLYEVSSGSTPQLHSSYKQRDVNECSSSIYSGRWNPHLDGNQFALIYGSSVGGVDVRSMQGLAWEVKSAHKFQTRDIDFNPNKQYYFATCGDDCAVRFWDLRNPSECLKELRESHTHWVWTVRYNSSHDQLVLTSGSDSRVVLHGLPSISSEPKGHIIYSEGNGEIEEVDPLATTEKLEDGVLAKYEEHEDAVYVVEWSSFDPWIFASLSYDGRLVINRVPESQKYKILLQ